MNRVEMLEKFIEEDEKLLASMQERAEVLSVAIPRLKKYIKGNKTRLQKLKEKGE